MSIDFFIELYGRKVHFRTVDIVTVSDEEEIIAAMEEIRNNPTNVA